MGCFLGDLQYEAVFICPAKGERIPLIVFPHGGPHSCYVNNWILASAFYAQLGYAVLRSKSRLLFWGSLWVEKSLKFSSFQSTITVRSDSVKKRCTVCLVILGRLTFWIAR